MQSIAEYAAGGGCSLLGSAPSVWKRHTVSADEGVQYESITPSVRTVEDVQYGSVTSSVWMKVCSTELPKVLRGLLVAVFNWKNDIL